MRSGGRSENSLSASVPVPATSTSYPRDRKQRRDGALNRDLVVDEQNASGVRHQVGEARGLRLP